MHPSAYGHGFARGGFYGGPGGYPGRDRGFPGGRDDFYGGDGGFYGGDSGYCPPHDNYPYHPGPQKGVNDHYLVTGVIGCYDRLEIHDFVKHEKFFSLYVQALQAVYSTTPDTNVESFFQIGGIHGRPYEEYAGAKASDKSGTWGGYCTHSTVLFPTWHRPYVALLEQVIQKRAMEIASYYRFEREAWMHAAVALRQPYWDWAVHSSPPPEVIFMQQVTITNAYGQKVLVKNPFYSYTFPPGMTQKYFLGDFKTWPTTLRAPTVKAPDALSDPKKLEEKLDQDVASVKKATYFLLSQIFDWHGFANHTKDEQPGTGNSLEAIHDGIHFKIGGFDTTLALKGHMGDNDYAGFDPIFFLHHANVDRLLSIWSALNPGVWVTPGDSADGTVSISTGTTVDAKTPLAPFWNSPNTFWTSAELQNTYKLGYSYPEFDGLDISNPLAVKTTIARQVNMLYGTSSDGSCAHYGAWDWTARVHIRKYDVGTSFAVLFFFGDVPADPHDWASADACVGRQYVMVNEHPENCANCRSLSEVVVEGFVYLNTALEKSLGSVDPEKVAPYLKEKLQWRVQKVDGSPASAESLEVVVLATPLSYPDGAHFPVAGTPRQYDSCTRGRAGGSRQTGNL